MKRRYINPISARKMKQLIEEKLLTDKLWIEQKGKCSCGSWLGWGSAKHEKVFRSQGGSPTNEDNCELLCLVCHSKKHGIEVKDG